MNGPPHGHGAFYGAPGGGANDAATRGARPGDGRRRMRAPTRATHRGVAPHGASAMDHAAASYEQMMAYQYGVERSRTFEAFKRAREGDGLNPGPPGPPLATHHESAARFASHALPGSSLGPPANMGASMRRSRRGEDAQALKRPRLVWTPALHKRQTR